MKNKYNLSIILLAIAVILLFRSNSEQTELFAKSKSTTFNRMPAGTRKAHQLINVDIDYEKLPSRNQIRLIGRVNAAHIQSDILDYKWTLEKNIILKSGSITGKINLKVSNEVTIDVAIKDMNKKINVKLEASAHSKKVKIGGIKTFTYDPLHEDQQEAESLEAQGKIQNQNLSKEEYLKQQMTITRKVSAQQ